MALETGEFFRLAGRHLRESAAASRNLQTAGKAIGRIVLETELDYVAGAGLIPRNLRSSAPSRSRRAFFRTKITVVTRDKE